MKKVLSFILLISLALSLLNEAVQAQTTPEDQARELLAQLSPEERVGQLFLVTFKGTDAGERSAIYDLIARRHVGGVVLSASNDNFSAPPGIISQAHQLITQLQTAEWESASGKVIDPATGQAIVGHYIPLFIGISQNGDGYPGDQILNGLTSLPSQMALGATWNPSRAEETGYILGKELSAVGFNLFFGPSLDVLENPSLAITNGLGNRSFGGDPYWVGEMGKAYIQGLHHGSEGRIMVVATHFPGQGSADRPFGEEIATIRKSLEQLKQIELAPFFAVTSHAPGQVSAADGLLLSHIRYQGFQGNIRTTTRPVSLDPQALKLILDLPPLASWRQGGGLLVSDDIGSQAIRGFYAPSGQTFLGHTVARDAFLAGNDLLYLGNILSSDAPDTYQTVLRILDFFTKKYQEDSAFAQRVDESALRILSQKFRLYSRFELDSVLPPTDALKMLKQGEEIAFRVAQQAATLLSPEVADLPTVLPEPPGLRDVLLFLTDSRQARQCSTCPEIPLLAKDALKNAVLDLYGPRASNQVSSSRLRSYSFDDLVLLLQQSPLATELTNDFHAASWIVISILDSNPTSPQGTILRRLLSERQDLLRNKRVILFAFEAPYYLDATNISKLSAYYGLYTKTPRAIEVAARLLFQELPANGALPVSVPGIGYDLFAATMPDPSQIIPLFLEAPPSPETPTTGTPLPTTGSLSFHIGDNVTVRTGIIFDRNRHPVPDGTNVRFTLVSSSDGSILQQIEAVTAQGIARAAFHLDRSGLFEIRATSEPASNSDIIQLNISGEAIEVNIVEGTSTPALITPTTTIWAASPTPASPPPSVGHSPYVGIWLVMTVLLAGMGYLASALGKLLFSTRWGLRWGLCTLLGGTMVYNYLIWRLPGSAKVVEQGGWVGILGLTLIGALLGLLGGWAWWGITNAQKKPTNP